MILIEENFLDKNLCKELVKFTIANKSNMVKFRDVLEIDFSDIEPGLHKKLCVQYLSFLAQRNIIVFPECVRLVLWSKGSKQLLHFDKARDTTTLTSITYLNDDFVGGKTFFENEVVVKPETGKTVFFNGCKYKHGVSQVTSGFRYVLAIWYSNDINELYL